MTTDSSTGTVQPTSRTFRSRRFRGTKHSDDFLFVPTKSVLIVEDDQDYASLIEHTLTQSGCKVLQASKAVEAVLTARQTIPSAIALDLCLPDGHGSQVLDALKQHKRTSSIPVLIVTGMLDRKLRHTLRSQGALDVFEKSSEFEKFLNRLQAVIKWQ